MVSANVTRLLPRRRLTRYLLAVGLYALALGLRFAILPVEARLAFATFYPACAFAFYLCGVGPGLLFLVLSAASGLYIFTPPVWSWSVDRAGLLPVTSYVVSALLIAWVVDGQRRTAQRLELSERRLDAIINEQSDIVCRFDGQGRIVFANDAARRLFRLDPKAYTQASWRAIVHPEDLGDVLRRIETLAPSNPAVMTENRILLPDGGWRWVEFQNSAVFDEGGTLKEIQTVGRDVTDRKAMEDRLQELTVLQQDFYDKAPCGYYSLDDRGIFLQINETALAWLGCTSEEVVGKLGPRDFFSPEDVARFQEHYPRFMAEGRIGPLEFDLRSRSGEVRRVSVEATAHRDAQGRFVRSRTVMFDITELHRAQVQMARLNREQNAMLNSDLIGIAKARDRHTVWANKELARMFHYQLDEIVGQPTRLLYLDDESHRSFGEAAYPVLRAGDSYRTQLCMRRKSGEPFWVDISGTLLSEETGESMWMMLDISEMRQNQERLEKLATADALTGLPNRILLADRLRQGIPAAQRAQRQLAICFIDLDGFKTVNDEHGHDAGDHLLRVVASRLQTCVRGQDTVARLGGDEFVLLLGNLQGRDECDAILRRVLELIAAPVPMVDDVALRVTGSVGVAIYPWDGGDPEQLMSLADAAMYRAKRAGKSRVMYHQPQDQQS